MSAQIIPFPKLKTPNEGLAHLPLAALQVSESRADQPTARLHIVRPTAFARTQQMALRIVEDVCLEHRLAHPAIDAEPERAPTFWATLPLPPARVETPISVAKRLAHLILPMVEHA